MKKVTVKKSNAMPNKTYTFWTFLILLCLSMLLLTLADLRVMKLNNDALVFLHNGDDKNAKSALYKASLIGSPLSYIPAQNETVLLYKDKQYAESVKKWSSLFNEECIDKKEYCPEISYNLGNALYRLGEDGLKESESGNSISSSTKQEVVNLWQQAIVAYQYALENSGDKEAQENIDFILQKLKELQNQDKNSNQSKDQKNSSKKDGENDKEKGEGGKSDKDKGDNSDTENKNGSKSDANKQSKGSDKQESGGEENDKEKGENREGSEGDASSENRQEAGNLHGNKQLSKEASQQLDQYMQQISQKEKKLGDYFNRNGQAAAKKQNSGPFDDPFFQQFFKGTPFEKQFSSQQKSLDKDW